MLHINDLIFRFGGRSIFDLATVHVPAGARVGLVGRNGTGKSTLFKLLQGEYAPDGGDINIRPRSRIGCLPQDAPDGPTALIDYVLACDQERAALFDEADDCHDAHRIAEIHERLNAIDAHSAPSRGATILAGLGFDAEQQLRPLSSFSGGWRMRVALAGVLFARPDLLLLDEPTNHLDLEATLWLQSYLASNTGTLIVISHDRELLNDVCTRIVHLEATKLVAYTGNYDDFVRIRREKMELATKANAKQADERKKIQAFIDRFKAKASKAAQAQSRVKMLERMGPPIAVVDDRTVSFDFPNPEQLAPPIISVEGGIAGYDGKAILRDLNIRVDMDDRIALLGANGNGKSTLSKILSGRMDLMEGRLNCSGKLKIGYFAQHQTDELTAGRTPFDHMAELMRDAPPSKVRAQLGRFGFGQDRADVNVEKLSGGEKARLLFALMSRDAPHLMILDEPTNHLDIDSREALVNALNAYEGAVVLVSHDPHLVELVADRLWLVGDGKVVNYDGDLNDYRKLLMDKAREARRGGGKGGDKVEKGPRSKEDRKAAAANRAQLAPLRKKVSDAEKALERLQMTKSMVDARLADPKLYQEPADKVTALQKERGDVDKAIAEMEAIWMGANDELEQAQA
ncbi:MAG: ABC-F family ATP-binding cassette domain-containing protein [Rhodospirillaceae bacterium]|nr:ABC-F family ATP-binding cassette domain-containing protein [Rhodospirillales bacterium]